MSFANECLRKPLIHLYSWLSVQFYVNFDFTPSMAYPLTCIFYLSMN